MNKQWNRLISVLLAFVMAFGMLIEVLPAASAETISDQETVRILSFCFKVVRNNALF